MATAGNPIPPVQAVAMIAIDTDINVHQVQVEAVEHGQLLMIAAALTADTHEEFAAGLDAIVERMRS